MVAMAELISNGFGDDIEGVEITLSGEVEGVQEDIVTIGKVFNEHANKTIIDFSDVLVKDFKVFADDDLADFL